MGRGSNGLIAAFVFASAALVAAQSPGGNAEAKKLKNPVASSPASIKAGQTLFTKNCRFCHGADAKGDGPMAPEGTHPSNLTDDKWDRGSSDGEIFAVIRDGAGLPASARSRIERASARLAGARQARRRGACPRRRAHYLACRLRR